MQEKKSEKKGRKPRHWALILLVCMEALNVIMGPKFWYELGVTYKDRGWTEAARMCMQASNIANPWSPYGKRADAYRKARLPAHNISQEAQDANIDAFNMDAAGRTDDAIIAFKALIAKQPDFEWPYNNLAGILVEHGQYEDAQLLSSKALQINPYYANAHATLADALDHLGQPDQANKHRAQAYELIKDCGN